MKFALMTPYTGTNLGDWAIQEATIANIRARYPEVSIHLVAIIPELTEQFHGVPSVPIDRKEPWPSEGAPIVHEGGREDGAPDDTATGAVPRGVVGRLKEAVKSVRCVYAVLKPLVEATRVARDEVRHIIRAYGFLKDVGVLVVSGGGQLDEYWGGPWDHPYALLKWGLLAKLTGTGFLVLSVGTCDLESKTGLFFIREALRLASYRSYRDRNSKELLKHLQFTRDDEVYPDLAFSYDDEGGFDSRSDEPNGKVVGVSPIAYLAPGWPRQNPAVFRRYFDTLTSFVRVLLDRGCSVVLFSTDGVDRAIVSDMADALAKQTGLDLSKLHCPRTHTLPELLEQLRRVDCVVASRLHGVILSHRFCLPVLAVSYDRKVDTHMEDMGLSKHSVDIHDFDLDSLVGAFDTMKGESDSIRSTLKEVNDRYARKLQHQYDAVLGRVGNAEAS